MPVERDLAFLVPLQVRAADIVKAALAVDRGLIAGAEVFDVYEGQGVPGGHKSVAIAVMLQPREGTLTDAQIEAAMARIVAEVAKKTGAALRDRDGARRGTSDTYRPRLWLCRFGRAGAAPRRAPRIIPPAQKSSIRSPTTNVLRPRGRPRMRRARSHRPRARTDLGLRRKGQARMGASDPRFNSRAAAMAK